MEATLSSLAPDERRQSRLRLVNFAAALSEEGATSVSVSVSDISEGGCRLSCDQPVERNSDLWLKLPGLEARRVRVAWGDGRDFGCEFETPLYAAEVEILAPTKKRPQPKAVFRRS